MCVLCNLMRKENETIDAENRTRNSKRTKKSVCGKMPPYYNVKERTIISLRHVSRLKVLYVPSE